LKNFELRDEDCICSGMWALNVCRRYDRQVKMIKINWIFLCFLYGEIRCTSFSFSFKRKSPVLRMKCAGCDVAGAGIFD
jgi:hypothetical protein